MQNNVVKRTFCALICSVLTALALLFVLYIPSKDEHICIVSENDKSDINISALEDVTLIGDEFSLSDYTKTVKSGEKAKISLDAQDGTVVSICAYYTSGKSNAKAFIEKTAENGTIVWEWTVPKNSKSDKIRIVLRSENTYATFNISII